MKRDDAEAAPPALIGPPLGPQLALAWQAPSLGWLEVALPLWRRRWRLVLGAFIGALLGLAAALVQPVKFQGHASFVVQTMQRPSQAAAASSLPVLIGLMGGANSAIDLHVAILRSRSVADRIIERFELQRAWNLPDPWQARARLASQADFVIGRREGIVHVMVEDDHPQRAAAMANEFVTELRTTLRTFALEEARQRRAFYDAQLAGARQALERAQRELQASGFDSAALRVEPRSAADGYTRLQAQIAAAEVRLAATRRVRADSSDEVKHELAELAAMRAQLATQEVPREKGAGAYVAKVRDYRYAEALLESLSRHSETARADEAADPLPLQLLDPAQPRPTPVRPQPVLWVLGGLLAGLALVALWMLARHRSALTRLDPQFAARWAQIDAVLPAKKPAR